MGRQNSHTPSANGRNLEARQQLVDLLRTGRLPIGVTGAGVSVWAGYPCWPDLITRLAQEVRRRTRDEVDTDLVIQNNTDLLHCAQRLGTYLEPDFARFIRAEFGDNGLVLHDVLFKRTYLINGWHPIWGYSRTYFPNWA